MGGGKDQKTANKQITSQIGTQQQQQSAFNTRNEADLNASRGRADDLYGSLRGGYQGLVDNPWASGIGGGSGGGGGGGGVGWAPDARFGESEDSYRNFLKTGGWTDEQIAQQQGRINSLTDIGKTGGVDEASQNRARGLGVYDEYAKTGGLSAGDIQNMRSRATSGIPAMYARQQAEANRQSAVQGGYGPGRAAMGSRLARQGAADIGTANLNAETGIRDIIDKNRQWGATGASTSETNLQDLLTRNKLAGLTGGSTQFEQMMQDINSGKQWGTQGIQGLAENERQAQLQASSANASSSRWDADFAARQRELGLEGLAGLYTSSPDEYMKNKGFQLDSANTYGNQVGGLGTQLKTNNKSWVDSVAQLGGAFAGGLSGLSGMSSMFKGKGASTPIGPAGPYSPQYGGYRGLGAQPQVPYSLQP